MKFNILLLFGVLCCFSSFSKENKYKVSEIPKELLANSKAIVRNEMINFEIESSKKSVKKVTYAITILNNNGIDNARFIQFHNKFTKLKVTSAKVYDKNGDLVKKIKSSDIHDISAISGFSLFEDNRVKYIDPEYRDLPFTVEYSYEISHNGLLSYPVWYANKGFNIGVQKSSFKIIAPKTYKLRYLEKNLETACKIENFPESTSYRWNSKNLKPIIREKFSLEFEHLSPTVITAPSEFEIGGYAGNFESWQNFGKWIQELNTDKDNLNDEKVKEIKDLVKDATTDKEKVKILYEHLQNKTRYVSIQVGIGGWQPFDANTVDKYSYSDCKGLSNYMKAMLNVINVKSHYTLIKAGVDKSNIISDFPSNQFNHAILCVPMEQDTIWLECTSQQLPFGHNGNFTDDRDALLITEEGGKLVKTPQYSADENVKITSSQIKLGLNESQAEIEIKYEGAQYDKMTRFLRLEDSEQKKYIMKNLDLQNFELLKYNHEEIRSREPALTLDLSVSLRKYSSIMGSRILVPLNLLNKVKKVPSQIYSRKSDIKIQRSQKSIDTITYEIPAQYELLNLPENTEFSTTYGTYKINIEEKNGQVVYSRLLILNKGIYPAKSYDEFAEFFKKIESADNLKFVLKKKG